MSEIASEHPWIIAGLGNPGADYQQTRHNAGFMVVDALGEKLHASFRRHQVDADVATVKISGHTVLLCKPLTFMNDSGRAVAGLARYQKVPVHQILVIYDDLDFDLGIVKLRHQGSPGTHNGVRSVVQHLGLQTFPRLRIGIGPRPEHAGQQSDFVLSPFRKVDEPIVQEVIEKGVKAVEILIAAGIGTAMNEVN